MIAETTLPIGFLPLVSPAMGADNQVDDWLRGFVANDYGKVVAAVAMATGGADSAEDAVQEALLKVLRDGHRPDRLAAWVTVVAANEVRRRQRRKRTEQRAITKMTPPAPESEDRIAEATDVRAAVAALPERQREVVLLHYYLDTSVVDVASAMGISEGTVKTQLHRARATLATALSLEEAT